MINTGVADEDSVTVLVTAARVTVTVRPGRVIVRVSGGSTPRPRRPARQTVNSAAEDDEQERRMPPHAVTVPPGGHGRRAC